MKIVQLLPLYSTKLFRKVGIALIAKLSLEMFLSRNTSINT